MSRSLSLVFGILSLAAVAGCAGVPAASSSALSSATSAAGGAQSAATSALGSGAGGLGSDASALGGQGTSGTTSAPGTTVNVSSPTQPCCPKQTLPQFLGITGLIKAGGAACNNLRNCLGSIFPGLEAVPGLTAIADASNLNSSNPEVAAAAGVKQEQDKAAQKIKAIRYLATVGCLACYPDVEDALLESLDDCTEDVRFEAAKALKDLAAHNCSCCKTKSCCSVKTRKKLLEVGNEHKRNGCWKESSQRVRRLARLAADGCCDCEEGAPKPTEGPGGEGATENPTTNGAELGGAEGGEGGKGGEGGEGGKKEGREAPEAPEGAEKEAPVGEIIEKLPEMMELFKGGQKAAPNSPPLAQRTTIRQTIVPAGASDADDCNCRQRPRVTVVTTQVKPPTPAADVTQLAAKIAQGKGPTADASQAARLDAPASPGGAKSAGPSSAQPSRQPARNPMNLPTVLAEVNGEPILSDEIAAAVEADLAAEKENHSAKRLAELRRHFTARRLERAIDRKLICQAARSQEMSVQASSFATPAKESGGGAAIDENVRAAEWLQSVVPVNTNVSAAEIESYYRAHQQEFHEPGMVRCEVLFAPRQKFKSAESAITALEFLKARARQAPAKYADTKHIEHKQYDWMRPKDAPPGPVAEAMFTLPVGITSEVLEDAEGWSVVRVLARRGNTVRPVQLVANQIRATIVAQRRDQQEQAFVAQLRRGAQIRTSFDSVVR